MGLRIHLLGTPFMATDDRKLILRIDFLWDAFPSHRCGRVYRVTGSPFVLPPVCESLRLLTFGENCDPSPVRSSIVPLRMSSYRLSDFTQKTIRLFYDSRSFNRLLHPGIYLICLTK